MTWYDKIQLWPFISYNWLFQWDYTFYKWWFLSTYNWYNPGHNSMNMSFVSFILRSYATPFFAWCMASADRAGRIPIVGHMILLGSSVSKIVWSVSKINKSKYFWKYDLCLFNRIRQTKINDLISVKTIVWWISSTLWAPSYSNKLVENKPSWRNVRIISSINASQPSEKPT